MAGIFLYEKSAPVLGVDARTAEMSCGYHSRGGFGEGIHARRADCDSRSDCYGMDYEFEDIGSFCDKNKSEMVAL